MESIKEEDVIVPSEYKRLDSTQRTPVYERLQSGVSSAYDDIDGAPTAQTRSFDDVSKSSVEVKTMADEKPSYDEVGTSAFVEMRRLKVKIVDSVDVNDNRRVIGVGFIGSFLNRDYRKSRLDSEIQQQIDSIIEYRYLVNSFCRR